MWRYMNFPKFVSLLQTGLFFSRVDSLGDSWEGTFPSGTATIFKAAADEIVARGDAAWLPEIQGSWTRSYLSARVRTYASCWQLAPRDVWWMWKVYCESEFGVAVQSTYERLDAELPIDVHGDRHIMLGCVSYGDYDSAEYVTDPSNIFSAVMSKRDAFADEREVRALCDAGGSSDNSVGFFVQVNLNQMLTRIVVSPIAPSWFRGTVEATTRASGCDVAVEDSRLRREPSLPY